MQATHASDYLLPKAHEAAMKHIHPLNPLQASHLSMLHALFEAYSYSGKGAEIMRLLEIPELHQLSLLTTAIRGLAHNTRNKVLSGYAFVLHDRFFAPAMAAGGEPETKMIETVLDSILIACERKRQASRAIDYFHSYCDGSFASPTLPSRRGIAALIHAHAFATPALWPSLAECLAVASATGLELDAEALCKLQKHYRDSGDSARQSLFQVTRILDLLRQS